MAKKNSRQFDVSGVLPDGYNTRQGVINAIDGGLLIMTCNKPNSSSFEEVPFPLEHVYAIKGGVGKKSSIVVKGDMDFGKYPSAIIDTEKTIPGFTKIITDEGEVLVRTTMLRASAPLAKSEAPPEKLRHEKKLRLSDPLVTKRPKKQISEKQKVAAKENLKKAAEKNKNKPKKKVRRDD